MLTSVILKIQFFQQFFSVPLFSHSIPPLFLEMTLDKGDQDTSLNVREGVQSLRRRLRCRQCCLIISLPWVHNKGLFPYYIISYNKQGSFQMITKDYSKGPRVVRKDYVLWKIQNMKESASMLSFCLWPISVFNQEP